MGSHQNSVSAKDTINTDMNLHYRQFYMSSEEASQMTDEQNKRRPWPTDSTPAKEERKVHYDAKVRRPAEPAKVIKPVQYKHFQQKRLNLSQTNGLANGLATGFKVKSASSLNSTSYEPCETPVIEEVEDDELRPMQQQPKASIQSKPGSHLNYQMKVKGNANYN